MTAFVPKYGVPVLNPATVSSAPASLSQSMSKFCSLQSAIIGSGTGLNGGQLTVPQAPLAESQAANQGLSSRIRPPF